MKKVLLNSISVIMVLALFFTSAELFDVKASAEVEPDFPCGGVIEEVDIKILYAPLCSRVVIGEFGPILTGAVLEITYPNGESEILTVKQNGNEYYAGDFSLYISNFGFEPIIINYGIVSETFFMSNEGKQQHGGYSGTFDFTYLNLPSFTDILYLISAYCIMWF